MTETPPTPPPDPKPSLYLNWEDWLPFFDSPDISLANKKKHIEALWTIVICFADAEYEVLGPDELSEQETSGQVVDLTAAMQAAVVNSDEQSEQKIRSSKEGV